MWMAEADALCRSVDPRRAGPPVRARAAAARRRLLVQPDRPDRPLHAPVEHPDRGAQAARLLRRRRLRRQHRLAHAGRPDAGRGPRDPAPRPRGLPDDDRPPAQRAAPSVRLRGGGGRNPRRRRAVSAGRRRRGRLLAPSSTISTALGDELRAWRAEADARIGAGDERPCRTAPAQRGAPADRAPARAAQLRARRAVRSRSRAQVRRGAAARSGSEPRRRRRRS